MHIEFSEGILLPIDLKNLFSTVTHKKVLVVGDLMVDEYIWGRVDRVSLEAPVIVVGVESIECRPGGAANVANNLRNLGAQVSLVGLIGDDEIGAKLISMLEAENIDVSGITRDNSRPTTRKTRVLAHSQQVVRVDHESRERVTGEMSLRLAEIIASRIKDVDAVIVSDYEKGVICKNVVDACFADKSPKRIVTAKTKPLNLPVFRGADVLMLNQSEAEAVVNMRLRTIGDVATAGTRIAREYSISSVVVTCGPQGLVVCLQHGAVAPIPAIPVEVYDVAGAGDTVISVLTLALIAGAEILDAAAIANAAGSAVVRKVGVATVTAAEIQSIMEQT